jgi:hypothetical protein
MGIKHSVSYEVLDLREVLQENQRKRKTAMEIELNLLWEDLDNLMDKIICLREKETLYSPLNAEWETLKRRYINLFESFKFVEENRNYALRQLSIVANDVKLLKQEMTSHMASWAIPQEPLISDEKTKQDFSHYADFLFEYIQYLTSLKETHSEKLQKYSSNLYGLRKDLKSAVRVYRKEVVGETFWGECVSLREAIHNFEMKVEDIFARQYNGEMKQEPAVEEKEAEGADVWEK